MLLAMVLGTVFMTGFGTARADQRAVVPSTPIPRDHGPSTKTEISLSTRESPGTIIISADDFTLDYVIGGGRAYRYIIGVGRDGFRWSGTVSVGRKAEWPDWRPPNEMRRRDPGLPQIVPAGPHNPLGARAIYLFDGGRDTLYRIHGTNDVGSLAGYVSSGCFRMTNKDIMDLYDIVRIGSKVVVR
jgi:lipoprotein-anchoring transpeptidase ErfK/SrfK